MCYTFFDEERISPFVRGHSFPPEGTRQVDPLYPRSDVKLEYEILIKEDVIALEIYTKYRATGLDKYEIEAIAKNTGLTVDEVTKLKEHIFLTEHVNLPNYETGGYFSGYFQPDMQVAHGWKIAMEGELTSEQKAWFKQLVEHELAESELMKQGIPYRDINASPTLGDPPGAHDIAPPAPKDFPDFNPQI